MPSEQFGPVSVLALGNGKIAKQLDRKLHETAQALRDFCFENGYDNTAKASAEVTLKVKFVHLESGMFAVRSLVSDKLPAGPPQSMHLVVENGVVLAPLAEELTEDDDPRQRTMEFSSDPANPGTKRM